MTGSTFEEITTDQPHKPLLEPQKRGSGRNNQGRLSVRHRGGGEKQHYRRIDFKRDKIVRSAGASAQLLAKEGDQAQVRLPSGEVRRVSIRCMATIGQVSNLDHENQNLGKAGRARHMGQRPEVRGVVMNPRDHPHGGGEGKSPTGMPPKTPWGKPAMGYRTRRSKTTGRLIVRSRHRKA